MPASDRSRWRHVRGVVGLAGRRLRHRLEISGLGRTRIAVVGVGLAVALMLLVGSLGLGLAAGSTVQASGTDYWIAPEQGRSSAVADVGGTRFGQVHPAAARLSARDDVAYATPVLVDVVRVEGRNGEVRRVLVVGIVPQVDGGTVVGLPTDPLSPGDPYFAEGSYAGDWTGEAVVSVGAAEALNVSPGETLSVGGRRATDRTGERDLSVTTVARARAPGLAQFPVVLVHLSEAQALTGAADGDRADRILVDARSPSARQAAENLYPNSRVLTRRGLLTGQATDTQLPLAVSIAATLISVLVGTLFIVTTIGFETAADAQARAVFAALGVSRRTRMLLVSVETLGTALAGGILGIALWLGGSGVIVLAGRVAVGAPLVVVRPIVAGYGLAVALVVGMLALPWLVVIRGTTTVREGLIG